MNRDKVNHLGSYSYYQQVSSPNICIAEINLTLDFIPTEKVPFQGMDTH